VQQGSSRFFFGFFTTTDFYVVIIPLVSGPLLFFPMRGSPFISRIFNFPSILPFREGPFPSDQTTLSDYRLPLGAIAFPVEFGHQLPSPFLPHLRTESLFPRGCGFRASPSFLPLNLEVLAESFPRSTKNRKPPSPGMDKGFPFFENEVVSIKRPSSFKADSPERLESFPFKKKAPLFPQRSCLVR